MRNEMRMRGFDWKRLRKGLVLKPEMQRNAFTLIELLVVVAIIVLLVAIMLPSLSRARQRANATRCLGNLKGIGTGLVTYSELNAGLVVPSYNMTGNGTEGTVKTVDGWPAILDRDGVVPGSSGLMNNIFYCPNTANVAGTVAAGEAATNPLGYQDYPTTFTNGTDSGGQSDPALPVAGFGDCNGDYIHEIRCGYWINAYNPIGGSKASGPCPYYTQSVGYQFSDGTTATAVKGSVFVRPTALVAAADGVYAGQQKNTHLGDTSSRIGYRHLGPGTTNTMANAVFADGHAEALDTGVFPRSTDLAGGAYSVLSAQ